MGVRARVVCVSESEGVRGGTGTGEQGGVIGNKNVGTRGCVWVWGLNFSLLFLFVSLYVFVLFPVRSLF